MAHTPLKLLALAVAGALAAGCADDKPPAKHPEPAAQEPQGSKLDREHEKFKKNVKATAAEVTEDVDHANDRFKANVKKTAKELQVRDEAIGTDKDPK